MTQAFDPQFNLTCVYTCLARLTQRHILSRHGGVMSMSHKVDPEYHQILIRLVRFFFTIQHLDLPRYLLVKEVPAPNIRNVIMGFSDGSLQFSTRVIYSLCYDCTGNKYNISLVSTLSKLADKPKSGKIMSQGDLERLEKCQQYDTFPKWEAHGLVLACN